MRANPAFFQMLHTTPKQSLNEILIGGGDSLMEAPRLLEELPRVIHGHVIDKLPISHSIHRLGLRKLLVNARPIAKQRILLSLVELSAAEA